MHCDLTGRHLVVTGGGGALGSAVVSTLLEAGATCHVPCKGARDLESVARHGSERAHAVADVELSDEAAVEAFYGALPALWGSIHLAGGFAMAPIERTRLADLRSQLDTNLTSCFLCCREAVASFRRGRGGRIVNVAARPALVPAGGMLAYTTAKAAVASLTACLADEVRAEGILVNAIVPSIIDTPANRAAMPDADHSRWPTPAELARAIAYLASPENAVTTGALVPVYGRA